MESPTEQTERAGAKRSRGSTGDASDRSGAYHTATAHFYRGEMQRLTIWRSRLDNTTHWAILITIGLTTFALGDAGIPHYIMLLGLAMNSICMLIEGRRYQHLHHSKWRTHLLEHNYFAAFLCPDAPLVEPTWERQLASDLARPHFTIGLWQAMRLRLRRNYIMLFCFLTAAWVTKLFIHPSPVRSAAELAERVEVGGFLPAGFVAVTAGLFVSAVVYLVVTTPSEEALEHWTRDLRTRLANPSPGASTDDAPSGEHRCG